VKHDNSILNGIRPDGTYAYPHPDDEEVGRWFKPVEPPPGSSLRGLDRSVNADDLASAGWAVVYAPGAKERLEPLLRDILDRRKDQAGDLYKEITLYPNESCDYFLERFGANTGNADPQQLPYYLLLVGNPKDIPFTFQGRLDQIYAVGRLHFDQDEHYQAYAEAVRKAEASPQTKSQRRVTLFGVLNGEDGATQRTTNGLIKPLADDLERYVQKNPGWQIDRIVGPNATRETLAELLTGPETPDLLFTASHGMVFSPNEPHQADLQGALLCSDWPGPGNPVTRELYLAAEDLQIKGRPLAGAVTFHLACHSGGTPTWDSFYEPGNGTRQRLAGKPFVAALPQRLLGEAGALAVIAHADRAWTTSFDWAPQDEEPNPRIFRETIFPLLWGYRVGDATESLGVLYGQLATHVKERWELERSLALTRARTDPARTARLWRASNDIRSFVVFGDPAVRVGGKAG